MDYSCFCEEPSMNIKESLGMLALYGTIVATTLFAGTNIGALLRTSEFCRTNSSKKEVREIIKKDFGQSLAGKVGYVASAPGRELGILLFD